MTPQEKKIEELYNSWMIHAREDIDLVDELAIIRNDEDAKADAFYRDLEFGTGGLRGVIGAGTNRMNIYTVRKASQGLADYVLSHFPEGARSIAVSHDSRIKSDLFAKTAAEVFAANGIQVHIYSELMPTPMLSWAVRSLHCSAGIMVTASHNPAKYNGYKVYGADGCQITTQAAAEILAAIEKVDVFTGVKHTSFDEAVAAGNISYIKEDVITSFIEAVKAQSVLNEQDHIDRDVAIVYSPLNGTGLKPVLRTLKETGFTNITVVKEQEQPDGHFPTCPYPNPEIHEAMALGMEYAAKHNADLLLATDPDCDRVGIAVKGRDGGYVLLSGNEVGMMLLDFICKKRLENGTMPKNPVFVKTIVTIDMAQRIAADYGVRTIDVLTGFKFIGEQIGILESEGHPEDYILGFEESYGYLSGSYVRDKDAVDGAFMICEMFAYYRTQGKSLLDVLDELYAKYGYCLNTLHSFTFEGMEGFGKMKAIMERMRGFEDAAEPTIAGKRLECIEDYLAGKSFFADKMTQDIVGLPASDVLKFRLSGSCSVVVRPSGTEPKLKLYISVSAPNKEEAAKIEKRIAAEFEKDFKEA